jgi:dephospho-CoA kinase
MIRVGLTGGIGSGKTIVAQVFSQLGVSVYSSDERAKSIMVSDSKLMQEISVAFGPESYLKGALNRTYIAAKVFSNQSELNKLNAIVHPALKRDFDLWCTQQKGVYIVKEAAILFESKTHIGLDKVILVTAPDELKISRVLNRDSSTRKEVLSRMDKQWSDVKKRALSDFEIQNDEQYSVLNQVLAIHKSLCLLA